MKKRQLSRSAPSHVAPLFVSLLTACAKTAPCPEPPPCPIEVSISAKATITPAVEPLPLPENARIPKEGLFACGWSGDHLSPGRIYHVSAAGRDTNEGTSEETAFATLQKAADTVRPGDSVLVHSGTYHGEAGGEAVLRIHTSGTKTAPITFKAAPGEHPIIQNNGWQAVQIADASYVIVEGFELIGQNSAITLEDALAHKTDPSRWDTNALGIQIWNHKTGGRSHHVVIRDNRIHDFGGGAIVGSECDCVTIANNVLYANGFYSLWSAAAAIVIWQPRPLVPAPYYKLIIRDNRIFDHWSYVPYIDAAKVTEPLAGGAILLNLFTKHGYAGPTLISGNIVYRNQECGILNYETINVDVVGNTLYENLLGADTDWGEFCDFRSHGSRVANNIFVARHGRRATFVKSTLPDTFFDYNLYWPEEAAVSERGDHDRFGDPRFLNVPGESRDRHAVEAGWNFHLDEGSAAIDAGDRGSATPIDAEGTLRSGRPDLGALERVPN